ncbi:hypothetical protein ACU8KH_02323 [Lachancea thermotolerans]
MLNIPRELHCLTHFSVHISSLQLNEAVSSTKSKLSDLSSLLSATPFLHNHDS